METILTFEYIHVRVLSQKHIPIAREKPGDEIKHGCKKEQLKSGEFELS